MTDPFPRFEANRAAILAKVLDHAPFDGWTARVLARAAGEAGLPDGADALYFPRGPVDAIDFWNLESDREMARTLAGMDLGALKVRQRIEEAVMARLAPARDHREAARRAAARLALHDSGGAGPRVLWRAADAMWRAVGDTSTDFNFYSKRAILASVLAATFPIFLDDRQPDLADTRAFLRRRINDVMTFEKAKARLRAATQKLPDLLAVLTRLRHGPARRHSR
jgi:ubiquinone biosynthesis protein COQ9